MHIAAQFTVNCAACVIIVLLKGNVMRSEKMPRGFVTVFEEKYQNECGKYTRLIQESSAIGDYDDSMSKPGSSFLWVGQDHHLNREQVRELIQRMEHWLSTGRLAVDASEQ